MMMTRTLFATVAALAVSTGAAFAADTPVVPAYQQPATSGFATGYLFPDDGSPSGDEPMAHVIPQQTPSGVGGLSYSHVWLFPPSEGSDSGQD